MSDSIEVNAAKERLIFNQRNKLEEYPVPVRLTVRQRELIDEIIKDTGSNLSTVLRVMVDLGLSSYNGIQ